MGEVRWQGADGGSQAGQVDLAHLQDPLARGRVGHELGDVAGDHLPGDAPAVDAPAAALGLGHCRQACPVAVDLLLVPARDDHGDTGCEGEVLEGPRVHGRHPCAAQGEVGEHDRAGLHRPAFLVAAERPAVGVVEQGDPGVSGLLGGGAVGAAEREAGEDEGPRLAGRVGEHEPPGHAEAVADPGVARREGVLAQLHEDAAGAEPLVELIKVGSGLFLAAEQKRIEVQDAADRRVRGVLVAAVDEREPETVDADRRRKPGRLLDDGALAEGLGVELGRLGGGAVAPDSGGDELIHADIVSGAQHTGVTHASAGALQAPLAGRLDRPGGHKLTEDLVGEPSEWAHGRLRRAWRKETGRSAFSAADDLG